MERVYQPVIEEHLAQDRQMIFLVGPRQVGKTTLGKQSLSDKYDFQYLNWDSLKHRELILAGADKIFNQFSPDVLTANENIPVIFFDELHKYKNWKSLLKGYFDELNGKCKIMITGSAKLNIYRKGGDSMMGRYFLYNIHPFSVAELIGHRKNGQEVIAPHDFDDDLWDNLLRFGGFPEPFTKANQAFYNRWLNLKQEQLFREDLRDLNKVHDVARIELLAQLLIPRVTSIIKYTDLAKQIQVSEPTIRQWISVLREMHYCFQLKPWSKNISRSLLKTPKIYCWDWSVVESEGARYENIVALHLRKAACYWTDTGLGKYDLYYLRDKDGREVDFLMTKNAKPWLLVEVKASEKNMDPSLIHFYDQLKTPHTFQVVADMPYIDKDCFALNKPMVVPLRTFLSQLV